MNHTGTDPMSEAVASVVAPEIPHGGVDAVPGAPTVQERIAAAEKTVTAVQNKIAALNRDVSEWFWFVMAFALGAVAAIAVIAATMVGGHALTVREASGDELLRPGTHCYSSSMERDAAAQRALAAIDRLHWEQTQALGRNSFGSPLGLPALTDSVAAPDDPDVCFTVVAPSRN